LLEGAERFDSGIERIRPIVENGGPERGPEVLRVVIREELGRL
jgi:hypothetical protein